MKKRTEEKKKVYLMVILLFNVIFGCECLGRIVYTIITCRRISFHLLFILLSVGDDVCLYNVAHVIQQHES